MELTPNDIRNYEFQTQMRGYDKDEVDSLVKRLAEMFEELKQENLKLSMETDSLKSQLESLKELEETIKLATIDARKNADSLVNTAKEEADRIVEEAKAEAEEIIGSREEERDALERKIKQLEETRKSFVDNLQGLISSHLNQLDSAPPPPDSTTDEIPEEPRSVEEMSEEMLENLSDSLEEDEQDEESDEEELVDDEEEDVDSVEYEDEEELEDEAPGLDPELGSTANNYEHVTSDDVEDAVSSQEEITEAPSEQDDTTEKSSTQEEEVTKTPVQRAVAPETPESPEDVPEGFVAQGAEYVNTNDTIPIGDYIKSQQPKPVPVDSKKSDSDEMTPESLAATLDSVVAKFEEEMDKADKS